MSARALMPRGDVRHIPPSALRCSASSPCTLCLSDREFLRNSDRPADFDGDASIAIVDLFAGCGGMTLGLYAAARNKNYKIKVTLPVDSHQNATKIYQSTFTSA